jgi:DNA-binding MarR family transcriptional regulator
MEAATKSRTASSPRPKAEQELALKMGALILHCMGGRGSEAFRVIDDSGLTFAQVKALMALEGPTGENRTVTTLAEELGISAASASRAAEGLVRGGLARRVEDPDDRRVRPLELTGKGRGLADRIISARLAGLEDFASSLEPAQRKKLETALDALLERGEIAEIYGNFERRVRR